MRTEYLTGFSASPSSSACSGLHSATERQLFTSGEVAGRVGLQTRVLPHCLDALAVHASLLRPTTTEAQRSRLTTTIAAIEIALTGLAPSSAGTEAPIARLRSLRQVISLPSEDIISVGFLAFYPPY